MPNQASRSAERERTFLAMEIELVNTNTGPPEGLLT